MNQTKRGRPHKCPYCSSTSSVAKGFRYNRSGKVRLRRCKTCGRRWTTGPVQEEYIAGPQAWSGDGELNSIGTNDAQHKTHAVALVANAPSDHEKCDSLDEGVANENRTTELPPSGEEIPTQDDPEKERKEESEKSVVTQ